MQLQSVLAAPGPCHVCRGARGARLFLVTQQALLLQIERSPQRPPQSIAIAPLWQLHVVASVLDPSVDHDTTDMT